MRTNVVASFLRGGGRITKLQAAVAVTELELLDYIRTCGFRVRYADDNRNGYICDRKRVNLRWLLDLANDHRRSHQLSLFTIRHLV